MHLKSKSLSKIPPTSYLFKTHFLNNAKEKMFRKIYIALCFKATEEGL